MTTADFPVRFSDALNKLDRTGRAVVRNDNPRDSCTCCKASSRRIPGKFYNGTGCRCFQEGRLVAGAHRVPGRLDDGKYLVEGEAMDQWRLPLLSLT